MAGETWIRELLIVLATAGLVVPLFGRLRFGSVVAFLIAGLFLGPAGFGRWVGLYPMLGYVTFNDAEHVRPFAELGVLFLLFLIGLEVSLDRLWAMRRLVFGVGSAQIVFAGLAIGLVSLALGIGFAESVVIALALALSSTAIASQVMIEQRRFAQPVGRLTLGVLLFQDLMVVPIVIIVGLLGGQRGDVGWTLARAAVLAVGAVVVIVIAGRIVVKPLMRLAGGTGSRELVVAIALFLAIGTALFTQSMGLSAALGAFLAGLLLGESEYRHQLEVDIEPFKGLLLGLFFMTVGMSVDVVQVGSRLPLVVGAVLLLVVLKAATMFLAARAFRVARSDAVESALVLAGSGEFAFVVFTLARQYGVLSGDFYHYLASVAALSMMLIPVLGALGRRAAARLDHRRDTARHGAGEIEEEFRDHVVIGGYGRVGRAVARLLENERIPYVALDLDAERVARARAAAKPVFYGDVGRPELLSRVGGAHARAFVVTTDNPLATERMVRAIREAWPQAVIHARARDVAHAEDLANLGVADVVPEALEASLQLAGRVLDGFGIPREAIEARLDAVRDAEIQRFARDRP